MRWDNLRLTDAGQGTPDVPPFACGAVTITFDTPEFRGMTFYEIHARSIVNRVPAASHIPFQWTINPYRGCTHSCTYCFARKTHEHLDLNAGHDFDSQCGVGNHRHRRAPDPPHLNSAKRSHRTGAADAAVTPEQHIWVIHSIVGYLTRVMR